jgi:replicative DNA helicase
VSSPDINLLALFTDKAKYERFKDSIKTEALLVSETATLLSDFEAYYESFIKDTAIDFDKLRTFIRVVRHPTWKVERHELYDAILTRVEAAAKAGVDDTSLAFFIRLEAVSRINDLCQDIATGKGDDLTPIIEIIERTKKEIVTGDVSELYGPTDLTAILDKRIRTGGIEWRLDCLNTSAGPLHGGDLVLLAARPEAGKTSIICSELTHMVRYLDADKDAVIFNPEEGGGRLFLRLLTSATGQDIITVAANENAAKISYEREVGRIDRIKVVEPAGGISTRMVEKVLDTGKFGLVAINVLDKIRPSFKQRDESEVSRYRSLAYWMREAANRYQVPIIAVAQASEAAEGQKYLTPSMIYGSKTGVQGEIDLFLGMGYDITVPNRRWLSLLKNKLPGGPKTVPTMKHGRFEVEFNEATGRYSDL